MPSLSLSLLISTEFLNIIIIMKSPMELFFNAGFVVNVCHDLTISSYVDI